MGQLLWKPAARFDQTANRPCGDSSSSGTLKVETKVDLTMGMWARVSQTARSLADRH